jgi:hypothetical protein
MEILATPGTLVGLVIGILAGMAIQHTRHVVRAYQSAKNSLPGLKEAAASAETRGAIWILAVAAVILLVLLVLVRTA